MCLDIQCSLSVLEVGALVLLVLSHLFSLSRIMHSSSKSPSELKSK